MTDERGTNMLCPKCRTFQPAAETCAHCGVVVAKLWSQRHPHESSDTPPDEPPHRVGGSRTPLLFGISLGVIILGGMATLFLLHRGGDRAADPYSLSPWQAAVEAQRQAESMQERIEQTVYEAEHGREPREWVGVDPRAAEHTVASLTEQFNQITVSDLVHIRPQDVRRTFRQCIRFPERYFPRLRFDGDIAPLPARATRPVDPEEPKGRYRCRGTKGVVFTDAIPRRQEGTYQCWSRQRLSARKRRHESVWVAMQWDEAMRRWSIFTVTEQRQADRNRLADAAHHLRGDLEKAYGPRERRAAARLPALEADVERIRAELEVLRNEENRQPRELALAGAEERLRRRLVEARSTQICVRAGELALEAKQAALAG